ncbi:MAG: lysophospholipid acyltransferase family protein [Putridiphycobacter sp.]
MLNRLLYYVIVLPISKLPLGLTYPLFYFFYLNLYYLFGYRKKVVMANVKHSFPQLSTAEQNQIAKQFYKYLSRLFAESVKNLAISEQELKQRMKVVNPELMDTLFDQKKSVVLMSSHYNNWEFLITAQNLITKHQAIGIGMPMTNKFWDKTINAKRERFGMKVVNAHNYKTVLAEYKNEPTATLVLGDQNPSKAENAYWTTFLNQTTPFFMGGEIMANQNDFAVVYAVIHQSKKGYYQIEFKLISDQPKKEDFGYITQQYIDFLEADIQNSPEFWLWSHKRWKMKIPSNLDDLKQQQKQRFEKKFRSKA